MRVTAPRTSHLQSGLTVAILMCTFNGQDHLAAQLDSFDSQTHGNWQLGSPKTDQWTEPLQNLSVTSPGGVRTRYASGPATGVGTSPTFCPYGSIRWLGSVPAEVPAVYCSRTLLVDCEDQEIGLSPLFRKPASFANALMQNTGGGNTMVFNNAARELLMQAGQDIDVAMHDWWVYLAVMACGGRVHYDPVPTVRYR